MVMAAMPISVAATNPVAGHAVSTLWVGDRGAASSRAVLLARRQAGERKGRLAEVAAALLLILKGYRILERRVRGPFGEIDLIAVRGRRLAFVEVKSRRTVEAAQESIGRRQSRRIRAAAERWVWRHPAYREHEFGLDAVLLGASFIPVHRPNALQAA